MKIWRGVHVWWVHPCQDGRDISFTILSTLPLHSCRSSPHPSKPENASDEEGGLLKFDFFTIPLIFKTRLLNLSRSTGVSLFRESRLISYDQMILICWGLMFKIVWSLKDTYIMWDHVSARHCWTSVSRIAVIGSCCHQRSSWTQYHRWTNVLKVVPS